MMGTNTHDADPYKIDPLAYLTELNGDLSPIQQQEHYQVLKLALFRVQGEDLATFDLALKQVTKKLGIPPKTVKKDLAALALDLCQVRDGAAEDSTVVQVVKALQEIVADKRKEDLWRAVSDIALPGLGSYPQHSTRASRMGEQGRTVRSPYARHTHSPTRTSRRKDIVMTTEEVGNEVLRWHVECALHDDCTTVEEITAWCFERATWWLQPFNTPQGRAEFQEEVMKQLECIRQDPSPCALTRAVEQLLPHCPQVSLAEALELLLGEPVDGMESVGTQH